MLFPGGGGKPFGRGVLTVHWVLTAPLPAITGFTPNTSGITPTCLTIRASGAVFRYRLELSEWLYDFPAFALAIASRSAEPPRSAPIPQARRQHTERRLTTGVEYHLGCVLN